VGTTAAVKCTECSRRFAWKPELAGKRVKCKCGARLQFPSEPPRIPPKKKVVATASPPKADDFNPLQELLDSMPAKGAASTPTPVINHSFTYCPVCRADVSEQPSVCHNCGTNLIDPNKAAPRPQRNKRGRKLRTPQPTRGPVSTRMNVDEPSTVNQSAPVTPAIKVAGFGLALQAIGTILFLISALALTATATEYGQQMQRAVYANQGEPLSEKQQVELWERHQQSSSYQNAMGLLLFSTAGIFVSMLMTLGVPDEAGRLYMLGAALLFAVVFACNFIPVEQVELGIAIMLVQFVANLFALYLKYMFPKLMSDHLGFESISRACNWHLMAYKVTAVALIGAIFMFLIVGGLMRIVGLGVIAGALCGLVAALSALVMTVIYEINAVRLALKIILSRSVSPAV